jgi:hypothetical protein
MKFALKAASAVLVAAGTTALAAFALFIVAPALWRYLKTLDNVDWAKWFLWLYLFGYFVGAAQLWYHEFAHGLRHKDSSRVSKYAALLLAPAWMPIAFIHSLLQGFLLVICFNYLHEQSKTIALRSFNVLCLVWISIYGILIFSNLWQLTEDQCRWIFPRILSCLLTKHEDLSGGLIGAGGTIFAAWVAWIAIQEQLRHKSPE